MDINDFARELAEKNIIEQTEQEKQNAYREFLESRERDEEYVEAVRKHLDDNYSGWETTGKQERIDIYHKIREDNERVSPYDLARFLNLTPEDVA